MVWDFAEANPFCSDSANAGGLLEYLIAAINSVDDLVRPAQVIRALVKKAIAKGIQDGFFGYCSGSIPALGTDGKHQVPLARVRFSTTVGEDEIDLESGFLMMPQNRACADAALDGCRHRADGYARQ